VRRSLRWYAVAFLGPLTAAAGLVWAFLQPYRITFLRPSGESFWWLVVEPPLLVIAIGIFFYFFVARSLMRELAEEEEREP
jgi:uncharacterized membrane protein